MTSDKKPVLDVSIVAANFNNALFLDDFIESVFASTALPKELIIVDDGSIDGSVEILKKYEYYDSIKIICFDSNKGLATASNTGVAEASGKYVMRADPDDIIIPDRIQYQFDTMEAEPDLAVIGSDALYFDNESGRIAGRTNFPADHKEIDKVIRKGEHGVLNTTSMFRSDVIKRYNYAVEQGPLAAVDIEYELFARMLADGLKFKNIKIPLMKVRIHRGSLSSDLSFAGMRKTFIYRDRIFNTRTSKLKQYRYFLYILFYRKSLLADNSILKMILLGSAALMYPAKAIKRAFS